MRVLVVTAVAAERDAVRAAGAHHVLAGGIGPAASAASTAAELSAARWDLVVCAGIGGGFAPLAVGDVAVASSAVFADLGADSADGFVEIDAAPTRYDVEPRLAVEIADRTGGHLGTVLTVATVTGTAEGAAALVGRFPDVVAEGMEGAGVAAAAALAGVPFVEVRAISNVVGPRDRDAWRIADALARLRNAITGLAAGWDE